MINTPSWRFRKHLGRFHMLTTKACSETVLFREFSNKDFYSLQFRKYITYDDHLFFQNVQNLMYIQEMQQKIERKFFVLQIIPFHFGVANSHNLEKDTCNQKSMFKQTPLRFHLTLGETYSKSTSLRMIKEHDESTLMEISQAVGTISHVHCQSVF